MSDAPNAVARTREIAAAILERVIADADGKSEAEIHAEILANTCKQPELYPTGWYDPPPGGASVLIGKERISFDSIRKPEYWPRQDIFHTKDEPMMLYLSPVDRSMQMIGDIALTVYQGGDEYLQDYFREGLEVIVEIAEQAQVGMTFDRLHSTGLKTIAEHGLAHARIATITPGAGETNFGHSVPWSDGEASPGELPIEELKEKIRVERQFISQGNSYVIPKTCAFTVESRMFDPTRPERPNVYFHVMVTFQDGESSILTNFDKIFAAAGMNYML